MVTEHACEVEFALSLRMVTSFAWTYTTAALGVSACRASSCPVMLRKFPMFERTVCYPHTQYAANPKRPWNDRPFWVSYVLPASTKTCCVMQSRKPMPHLNGLLVYQRNSGVNLFPMRSSSTWSVAW